MSEKSDSTKNTRVVSKIYQENLGLMIAVSDWLFRHHRKIVTDFDEKYKLFNSAEIQKEKPFKWTLDEDLMLDSGFLDKYDEGTRWNMNYIRERMAKDFKDSILSKIKLPLHFHSHLWNLIAYGDVGAPGVNFSITFQQIDPKSDIRKATVGGMQYASLNVYKPLSTAEKVLADKLLNGLNSIALHKSVSEKNNFNNVVLTLKILDDTINQGRSKRTKKYTGYLAALAKAVDRGDHPIKALRKLEKQHPDDVVIEKGTQITSDKISKKLRVSSGENVRTIIKRHKKKMNSYFEKLL